MLKRKLLPSRAYLAECFKYSPDGKLVWRIRPRHHFLTSRGQAIFNAKFSGRGAFTSLARGYAAGKIGGQSYYAHRLIWKLLRWTEPVEIDHINGDKTDNRIENLRNVTRAENMRNCRRYSSNSSGVTGVYFDKRSGKWAAAIRSGGRHIGLGLFAEKRIAVSARLKAQRVLGFDPKHGREARITADAELAGKVEAVRERLAR